MNFRYAHDCITVIDMEKSVAFYHRALNLNIRRKRETADSRMIFVGDDSGHYVLEIREIKGRTAAYDLGDNEGHICYMTDDTEGAFKMHSEMGIVKKVIRENEHYFIVDPDGYMIEIVPYH